MSWVVLASSQRCSPANRTLQILICVDALCEQWGGVYFTPGIHSAENSSAKEEALWVMDEADRQLQSWTHWDIDWFLSVGPDPGGFTGCNVNRHDFLF